MSFHILLSDDAHLHQRNFASLFEFLNTTQTIKYSILHNGSALWNRYGEYAGVKEIESIAEQLRPLNEQQLRELNCKIGAASVNAFEIARAEILSFVINQEKGWYRSPVPNKDDFIFSKLYSQNNALLRLNIAAVMHWCNIYGDELSKYPGAKVVIVFSGSQIYQRLLLEYCRSAFARAIVVETFQTGDDFYFEERYTPITVGSDIRYPTVYNSLKLPSDAAERQNERNKALNKILNGRNKNVTQPDDAVLPRFNNGAPCILISAQVQNDFSILESRLDDINALSNYRELIDELLSKTNFNVVVKTHPWERRKTRLGRPFIYEELTAYFERRPIEERNRIHICENENIRKLLNRSDAFVTLTSQSAFEACLYSGLRPYTMGLPFYSGKGFTNDYQNARDLVASLREDSSKWRLNLCDYDAFLDFTARLLQAHLASVHQSGLPLIRDRIFGPAFVEVGTKPRNRSYEQNASTEDKRLAGAASNVDGPSCNTLDKVTPNVVWFRRPLVPIIRAFVAKIGSKKDVREFNDDPSGFFAKLRNPWYRVIGTMLFPPGRD